MTIVVNAVAAKMGGAATYVRELVRELVREAVSDRFIFYVPPEQTDPGVALPAHIQWRITPVGHAGALRRLWWDQVTLRRFLRRERADVLFSTANFAMYFCPVPQVLAVRNALHFSSLYRSRFLPRKSWRFRLAFGVRTWLVRLSLRQVDAVMVPSKTLLEEIRASGAVLPENVVVSHYGTRVFAREGAAPAEKFSPDRPFCLVYAGLYTEHKNLGTVFAALKRLREKDALDFKFITTADPSSEQARGCVTAPADRLRARDPAIAASIEFVAPGSPASVERLYLDCDAVIYPSLVESFGHPLVEALACGVPVIASDVPINRELAGSVPLYFRPLDPEDLAEKILRLGRDPELRAQMRTAGPEQVRACTWEAHVARLRTLLAEVAREKR